MVDVILTRSVGIRGEGYAAGTQLTLADEDAETLILMGKAVKAPEVTVSTETPAEAPEESPPAEIPAESVSTEAPAEAPEKHSHSRKRSG